MKTTRDKEIDKLEKERLKNRAKREALYLEKRSEKAIPEASAKVGKCFKLKHDAFEWQGYPPYFTYRKIVNVKHSSMESRFGILLFEKGDYEQIKVYNEKGVSDCTLRDYTEITQKEFSEAFKSLQDEISKLGEL